MLFAFFSNTFFPSIILLTLFIASPSSSLPTQLHLVATETTPRPLDSSNPPINRPAPERDSDLDPKRCPDFCAGTKKINNTSLLNHYVCDDPRLGPLNLPSELPIEGISALYSSYHRFGGLCPGEFLKRYISETDGKWLWPPWNGYSLTTSGQEAKSFVTLLPGTFLDRFGGDGVYMSAAGSPFAQRSLPPSYLNTKPKMGDGSGNESAYPIQYRVYTVTRSFVVQAGPVAGWFGQQGLGLQFVTPKNVSELVEQEYLDERNLTVPLKV